MIKKTATTANYTIVQHDSGSIEVYQVFDNTIGALREVADEIGFDYDEGWNTRTFGWKLIQHINGGASQQTAQSGAYLIIRHESGTIEVRSLFSNTIGALRDISSEVGFDYDEGWNTRTFGSKLIDAINQ